MTATKIGEENGRNRQVVLRLLRQQEMREGVDIVRSRGQTTPRHRIRDIAGSCASGELCPRSPTGRDSPIEGRHSTESTPVGGTTENTHEPIEPEPTHHHQVSSTHDTKDTR
jgi:hypothetical protein